ncbi:MAG TPA: chemotaxis protein CheW [Gemmatimonadales bacterium]
MSDTSRVRLLVWRAGSARCAAPIERLREILLALPVTVLPGAPAAVRGVANVRGTLVTVVDGRRLLGEPDDLAPETTVLVQLGNRAVGLAVDDVEDLVEVGDGALIPRGQDSTLGWDVRLPDGPPARLLDLDQLLDPLFRD